MNIIKIRKSFGNTYAVYTCTDSVYNMFGSVSDIPLYLCGVRIYSAETLGKIVKDQSFMESLDV